MSINNRRKALALSSAGAYGIAVYFTYQFLTPDQQEESSPTNNTNTNLQSETTTPSTSCNCYTTDPKRTQTFSKIAQVYDDQINRDEIAMGLPLLRRALLYFHAKGNVLEVGAGTGRNIDYYPSNVDKVVLTDTSDQMLLQARTKIQETTQSSEHTNKFQVFVADASTITTYYPPNTFDTIVDTFGLCSFDNPLQVLTELQRICKPNGKILLLEHGRSKSWQGLSNYLDKHAERHAKNWGCVWNRDIDLMLEEAGLVVDVLDTWHFGTTYYVVCRPGDDDNTVELLRMKEGKEEEEEDICVRHKRDGLDDNTVEEDGRKKVGWWKRLLVWPSNREQ